MIPSPDAVHFEGEVEAYSYAEELREGGKHVGVVHPRWGHGGDSWIVEVLPPRVGSPSVEVFCGKQKGDKHCRVRLLVVRRGPAGWLQIDEWWRGRGANANACAVELVPEIRILHWRAGTLCKDHGQMFVVGEDIGAALRAPGRTATFAHEPNPRRRMTF